MGIDIELAGKFAAKSGEQARAQRIAQWISTAEGVRLHKPVEAQKDDRGNTVLVAQLFPCCDPCVLVLGPSEMIATARTSQTGPGYHQHVCDVLKRLAQQEGITWAKSEQHPGDETGYLDSGDRTQLERAMTRWLGGLCEVTLKQDMDEDSQSMLCMSFETAFEWPGAAAITPGGPRSLAWMKRVQQNPDLGRDFWPWWEEGETAQVLCNRAKWIMWSDLCWRAPLGEPEAILHNQIHELLEVAYRKDASVDIPCREWAELLTFGAVEDVPETLRMEVEHAAKNEQGELIGYRRRPITRSLGLLTLKLPGEFAETVDEEGAWVAFGPGRNVRISTITFKGRFGLTPSADKLVKDYEYLEGSRRLPEVRSKQFCKCGQIAQEQEEGEHYTSLQGILTKKGAVVLVTITWDEPRDEPWGTALWDSLKLEVEE